MNRQEGVVRTSCRGCHGVCQVLVHSDAAGRIVGISGDAESPTSRGYICPKGAYAAELLYHPERLPRPLLRKKGRGENAWEAISWDAATSMIAERFERIRKESGPEYIAIARVRAGRIPNSTPVSATLWGRPARWAGHMHLALRPGTECALMLAMIHVIIKEKAYDAAFVRQYCEGFDALKAHVASCDPQWAEGVTWGAGRHHGGRIRAGGLWQAVPVCAASRPCRVPVFACR